MRAALSSVLSIGTGNRVKLCFQDQRLVFQCTGDCVSASVPIEVIALTGTPAGDYWFNAKQLVTCLKALSGTVTLGIAQGGMLTLATQDAYYLQNGMRPEAQKKTQKAAQPAAAKAAYYPIAQAKAWLSGHDKVESCDLLALKNYLWRLPSDREKVEAVLTRLCVNPMQDKVNNIRGMALESQEEFDAALGDGSKADTARKAFIKLRGELTHLYQMQCSLRTAAQSDSEIALADDLLADLEKISRKAHERTHFTYTTLEEIAALN